MLVVVGGQTLVFLMLRFKLYGSPAFVVNVPQNVLQSGVEVMFIDKVSLGFCWQLPKFIVAPESTCDASK